MNILIVSQYYWPENFKINDFSTGMKESGHTMTVLTGKPNYPGGKFHKNYNFFKRRKDLYNGIRIIRSPIIPRGNSNGFILLMNYLSFAFFASLSGIFRIKGKYDVIFVYEPSPITVGIPAILLKKKLKVPLIFWVQDLWPESVEDAGKVHSNFIQSYLDKLVRIIYRNSDRIFISSRSFSRSIEEKNVDPGKIVYFPNWPEEQYISGKVDKQKFASLMPVGFKIMFAGNIGEAQDFESIIAAAAILKEYTNIHWMIVGDGRKKKWMEDEVARLQLTQNFHILGSFPGMEMPNLFFHSDVMLVSLKKSKIFSLTVPAKLQTYLAFGKPVLAMMDGEGAEIIKEAKAGLTCAAGDFKKLSDNIKILYSTQLQDLLIMGENGRKYCFENFDRVSLFRKFESVCSDLTSKKN